ncbi:DUF6268 family outer membrane beta-barrel protein [Formosa sp. L2A11]|uniref:DUF6268 family outer membrane beta-barrel protein n=1 Tax=Formosa sp. L2A11 TaxID=2686363 RepID=UPI00131D31EE|nr:DUF6268 family outer membrane beta-barrel protein [Formosa sp. L2A11]
MKKVLILLLLLGAKMSYAQDTDGIYVNSDFFPSYDVGSVIKLEAGLNYPVINTSTEKFTVGGKVQSASYNYVDDDVPFDTEEIEDFKSFSIKLKYQRSLSDSWALNLMGETQVSSNFGENEIKGDDLFFNALVTLEKYNEENNTIWTFGAAYDIKYGLNYPIPVLSYTKRLDEAWAYKIGVPDMRVKWTMAENHEFEGFATLTGFTGNINDGIDVYKIEYSGTLRQTSVLLGLGYNYTFLKHFKATVNGGYSVYNSLQIKDYDNEEVYDFDMPNSFYFNVGLKYEFKNKTKVKSVY